MDFFCPNCEREREYEGVYYDELVDAFYCTCCDNIVDVYLAEKGGDTMTYNALQEEQQLDKLQGDLLEVFDNIKTALDGVGGTDAKLVKLLTQVTNTIVNVKRELISTRELARISEILLALEEERELLGQ